VSGEDVVNNINQVCVGIDTSDEVKAGRSRGALEFLYTLQRKGEVERQTDTYKK
jgi:hypothetical protein